LGIPHGCTDAMALDIHTGHMPAAPNDACFRLAMASAGIGMAIVSLEGTWVEVNPALCRMLGVDAQALLGHNVREFTDPADAARSTVMSRSCAMKYIGAPSGSRIIAALRCAHRTWPSPCR